MSRVVAIREKLKEEYADAHGVKLTYLPFIARATVDALGDWPWLNAEIRGDQIVIKRSVNLGIAVALDDGKGLIVPVIQERRGEEPARHRARDRGSRRARPHEEAPARTTSRAAPSRSRTRAASARSRGTPIINQPQVGDPRRRGDRQAARSSIADELGNDVIAIRPIMNLCLSYDHRLVDGAYAAPFMRDLKISLETWDEGAY